MAVGLCHSDKKSVCRNLQYNENVNMPDSPGWKWVQTVQTETADRYLIRLKSREEGRARKTYRVEVKEDTVDAKSAPNVTQIASAPVASAVGDYFCGPPLQLTLVKSAGRSAAGADTYRDCRDTWA